MNFVGKSLIVLNLVLCLLFMAFASAVYTAQKNWNTAITTGQTALTNAKNQADQDRQAYEDAKNDMKMKLVDAEAARDAATSRVDQLTNDLTTTTGNLNEAREQRNAAQTEAKIASEESQSRIAEAEQLRVVVSKLNRKIDDQIDANRALQDDVISLTRKNTVYETKQVELLTKLGNQERLLRLNEIDPDEIVDAIVQDPPPRVFGKVLEARKNASQDTEYVEVTIGSDDGLQKGHTLWVYRGEKFLADIRLIDVRPDRSLGQVVKRAKNGVIKRDDNVASRL